MGNEVLTTQQAADVLGLRPGTLEVWRWKGTGPPHIRLSKRAVRYRRADLDVWLASRVRRSTSDTGGDDAGAS